VQYLFSGEYDYERIPVPEVTDRNGKDLIEKSGIFFSRVDAQLTTRSATTFEAFSFPTGTVSHGLSPRREEAAAVNLHGHDLFGGVTHRVMLANTGVVTWRLGAFARSAGMDAKGGTAVSVLTHVGWGQNWFASGSRHSQRLSTSLAWDRTVTMRERSHELSALTEVAALKMNGEIVERPVHVLDDAGNLVRKVTFGGSAALRSRDVMVSAALRDVWHVTDRAQVDLGVRLDSSFETSTVPSARVGLRYVLDQSGRTTLKGGAGMFVGVVPLAAMAFGGYPVRSDASFDAAGTPTGTTVLTPSVGRLSLPRAYTGVVALEREIAPGLDGQMVVTLRNSYQLPKLNVPAGTGDLRVDSSGRSTYRELQLSVRKTWPHDQLLFVSYVLSSAVGELNEFATLFQNMDAPLLNAGGRARSTNDARHRVLAWGTFNLPLRTVISPVTEWHSGFTYSSYSSRYTYTGTPNSREFPRFLSTDMVAYKTVTVRGRTADVGFQLFNVFNNRNPRDVFPVAGTARYGEFANSVGRILRGYILVKW
jgi:hypothetical protein